MDTRPPSIDRRARKAMPPCRQAQCGVAAVEFAIVLVPLLIIAFGAAEYGRAIYQFNTLVKTVRSAARMVSSTSALSSSYAGVVDNAKCLAVYGNVDCTAPALAPGLTTTNVKVCDRVNHDGCPGTTESDYLNVPAGGTTIDVVEVRISDYTYQYLGLPFVTPASTVNFSTISAVMMQSAN